MWNDRGDPSPASVAPIPAQPVADQPKALGQSRRHSFLEAWLHILVGLGVSLAANAFFFPLFGWKISAGQNFALGVIYTVISLVRSYLLRRAFNRWHLYQYRRDQAREQLP